MKLKYDWTFADGSTTEIEVTKGEYGQLSVVDLGTGEDLQDIWEESDFPELFKGESGKSLEQIVEDLKGNKLEDVLEIFEDYAYNGVSEIIFHKSSNNGYDYIAYANTDNSPQVLITVDGSTIINVWT